MPSPVPNRTPRSAEAEARSRRSARHAERTARRRQPQQEEEPEPVSFEAALNGAASSGNCIGRLLALVCRVVALPFCCVLSILFVGLPLMFALIATLCMYYCCTREPMRPMALFRHLQTIEAELHVGESTSSATEQLSASDICALVIRRELLQHHNTAVGLHTTSQDSTAVGVNVQTDHTTSEQVWLETPGGSIFQFSAPLAVVQVVTEQQEESNNRPKTAAAATVPSLLFVHDTGNDHEWSAATPNNEYVASAARIVSMNNGESSQEDTSAVPTLATGNIGGEQNDETTSSLDTPPPTPPPIDPCFKHVTSLELDDIAEACDELGARMDDVDDPAPSFCTDSTPPAKDSSAEQVVPTACVDNCVRDDELETTCGICLLTYETGDVVVWSKNPQCQHYFHEECAIDCLKRKPACPFCRRDYLNKTESPAGSDENV